ncbi:MAG TPA: HAMP domain-containing protein, partial [Gemmataceae bacterium]|nr:HAMP domain-containing protein [Gemmataceae bacterium]
MAGRWRIRHKLMLGLGLVVAVMAILLLGTVYGLLSYRLSTNTMEIKEEELLEAQKFKETVSELARPGPPAQDFREEAAGLRQQVEAAHKALMDFSDKFQWSLNPGKYLQTDSYNAHISGLVQAINRRLDNLKEASNREPATLTMHGGSVLLRQEPEVKEQIKRLGEDASDLQQNISNEVNAIKGDARRRCTLSFWIVGTTSVLSVLLMAGLLRFFYHWVFHPVRDLMEGVSRVAQANFEPVIEVKSGDEMQELAAAFNDMTRRLRDLYRNLAQQVNERSRQLVRSERLASVGFLAAGVAHEINNPLASIAFCSEALEARLAEILAAGRGMTGAGRADSEVIFKYLKMIQEEAFRCKDITQKLLEFSRGAERRREPT